MPFTLEALDARHGDALLLHYGPDDAPGLLVIDGGPARTYPQRLRPRLRELRDEWLDRTGNPADAPFPIRLLVVSHIDDDHVHGVIDLAAELAEAQKDQEPLPFVIEGLWHNSFDDLLGKPAESLAATLSAAVSPVGTGDPLPPDAPISHHGAALVASVGQGRRLRDLAHALALPINIPFPGLVTRPADGRRDVPISDGLTLTVLGPSQARVDDLQAAWDKKLREMGVGREAETQAAAFVDGSVFNLASIVLLAEQGGRTMLLTGDARGDDILDGLRSAGLLNAGHVHVDVLKVPHHGSDRNVSTGFFRAVTADHYVLSGDGKHDNPELATLDMLLDARGGDAYTLHLTHRENRIENHLAQHRLPHHTYTTRYRNAAAPSLVVSITA